MFSTPPPQHRHRHSSHFPTPVNDVKCAEQKLWVNISKLWGLFFSLKVSRLSSTLAVFLLRLQHPPPD